MKRFTILFTALLSVLAFSAVFQAWSESRVEAKKAFVAPVYDSTGTMLEAIPADDVEVRIAPVYDATGAMLEALNPNKKVVTVPAYDATGAMLDAIHPNETSANTGLPIVYDATGAMLEAIKP